MSERTRVVVERQGSQWPQFLLLMIIAFGVVLGVAMLRPFIFDNVVPAILGPFPEESAITQPIDDVDSTNDASNEDSADEDSADSSDDIEITIEEIEVNEATDEDNETSEPQIHVVQPGQTLNVIARQYDVTTAVLIEANDLNNPDVLSIGQEIVIPQE